MIASTTSSKEENDGGRNRRFLLGRAGGHGAGLRKPNRETDVLMKRLLIAVVVLLVVGLVGAGIMGLGCSKERKVETDKLSQAFSASSAEVKAEVQTALSAIKTRDFTAALTSLDKVVKAGNLTDSQKQAIGDSVTDITVIISETPPANADELFDKVADITEAVGL